MSEQPLKPKEKLIAKIKHECEKLTYNIERMKTEQKEAEETLKTWEYLSFDLKEAIRGYYSIGLKKREQDLNEMTENLERLGAF